jgi:hypothetical protein
LVYTSSYWLPKPFQRPQSGHSQTMLLQDMPQMFSCMQAWQMAKPQGQLQQKGAWTRQQWHCLSLPLRFRLLAWDCAVRFTTRTVTNMPASVRDASGGARTTASTAAPREGNH